MMDRPRLRSHIHLMQLQLTWLEIDHQLLKNYRVRQPSFWRSESGKPISLQLFLSFWKTDGTATTDTITIYNTTSKKLEQQTRNYPPHRSIDTHRIIKSMHINTINDWIIVTHMQDWTKKRAQTANEESLQGERNQKQTYIKEKRIAHNKIPRLWLNWVYNNHTPHVGYTTWEKISKSGISNLRMEYKTRECGRNVPVHKTTITIFFGYRWYLLFSM